MIYVNVQSGGVSINLVEGNTELSVFPNPASSDLFIQAVSELGAIKMYNVIGQTVIQTISKNNRQRIDISSLPQGLYTIVIKGKSIRIIKE